MQVSFRAFEAVSGPISLVFFALPVDYIYICRRNELQSVWRVVDVENS